MGQPRYIYVFPPSVLFDEVAECYRRAGRRLGWMTVENEINLWIPTRKDWYDPETVVVFWGGLPEIIPPQRKAKCVFHYIESIPTGDPQKMIGPQREWLERHLKRAKEPDLFLIGTPSAQAFLAPLCNKVALMPIGYDPTVMGVPNWNCPKIFDVGFCGTVIGRREWIIPALKKRFGRRFLEISPNTRPLVGRNRSNMYDLCRAELYIGHSEDIGVGLRLWQALPSSAAFVTEDRDAWPAVLGRHYIGVPHARAECPDVLVDDLEQALKLPLADIARAAHEDLSKYTVERCFEEFLVPAVLGIETVAEEIDK